MIIVPIAEIRSDPTQPERFEKKTNIAPHYPRYRAPNLVSATRRRVNPGEKRLRRRRWQAVSET